MAALMLQHREPVPGSPIVIEWDLDGQEPHCHESGGLIIIGTDRCEQHADAELSCVFEWRSPRECEHPRLNMDNPDTPRCVLCGVFGRDETAKWLKRTAPAAALAPAAAYDEIVLGDPDADHSSLIVPTMDA